MSSGSTLANPMPFTLAHPAAILPLHARWRAGFWGLVVGSLGPDIPYYLPTRLGDALPRTHGVVAAATVAAPLSLLLLAAAVVCRRVLAAPLWGALRVTVERTLSDIGRSPSRWLHLVPAAVIGAEIHLLWDSFTHKEGWMVLHLPALTHDVSPIAGQPLKLFRALQYLSSVAGMALLVAWCRLRLKRQTGVPHDAAGPRPWILGAFAAIALAAAGGAVRAAPPRTGHSHTVQYVAATSAVGTFLVLYVLLGAVLAVSGEDRRGTPPPGRAPL